MSDAALGACEDATLSRARPVVIKVDARARVGVLMAPGTALLPANLRDGTLCGDGVHAHKVDDTVTCAQPKTAGRRQQLSFMHRWWTRVPLQAGGQRTATCDH